MQSLEAGRADRLLADAARCLLAFRGPDGPSVAPMAFWWDGSALWMTIASSVQAGPLRRRPDCVVYVPAAAADDAALVLRGAARVYDLQDPLRLLLHAPVISAAMAALAVRSPGVLLDYAQDLRGLPAGRLPPGPSVLRVSAAERALAPLPDPEPGIAPALPAVVPSDIRRALGGRRRVVLVSDESEGLTARRALWGAGGRLSGRPAGAPAPGTAVVAVVDDDPRRGPTEAVGVALHGRVDAGGTLRPERVTWWHGLRQRTADVPAAPSVSLPD